MVKIAHFLQAGCVVKILIADVHGYMDADKSPIELVPFRAQYYTYLITSLLKSIGVPLEKLQFVLGSDYQYDQAYMKDLLRISTVVSQHDARKAGADVVKQSENAKVANELYPLMQCLDEQHLDVDAQFGGVDQRKIFVLATEVLPKMGYKSRAHLMNPMVPSFQKGGKMSSSDVNSKIDVLESAEMIRKKVNKADAVPREVGDNGLMAFVESVLLPISALQDDNGKGRFTVERRADEGEALVYSDIETLKQDYMVDRLTPQLLKAAVSASLVALLAPIQAEFLASKQWQEVELKAYPPDKTVKKEKKQKDKGTRHPGAVATAPAPPNGEVEMPSRQKA